MSTCTGTRHVPRIVENWFRRRRPTVEDQLQLADFHFFYPLSLTEPRVACESVVQGTSFALERRVSSSLRNPFPYPQRNVVFALPQLERDAEASRLLILLLEARALSSKRGRPRPFEKK